MRVEKRAESADKFYEKAYFICRPRLAHQFLSSPSAQARLKAAGIDTNSKQYWTVVKA
ncbi:MAG: DUF3879 family protein [Acetatifactor sp.]|nr:DUF3879 family protein [Acetatifactor sp.]